MRDNFETGRVDERCHRPLLHDSVFGLSMQMNAGEEGMTDISIDFSEI